MYKGEMENEAGVELRESEAVVELRENKAVVGRMEQEAGVELRENEAGVKRTENAAGVEPVAYTQLTLPTKRRVAAQVIYNLLIIHSFYTSRVTQYTICQM